MCWWVSTRLLVAIVYEIAVRGERKGDGGCRGGVGWGRVWGERGGGRE